MKKLTAVILSICLGAAGLAGCQSGQQAAGSAGQARTESSAPGQAQDPGAGKERAEGTGQGRSESSGAGQEQAREADSGKGQDEGQEASKGASDTKIITDHAGNQVEIPNQVNRVVVTDIFPIPSIITVLLGSGEKVVGMNPASMSAARTGLLGELFPDILNAGTDFMNGSDINMEELMKLEPDVVIYSAGSKELGEALRAAGFAAVGISVNKWDYDSIETYDQWIALLSEIFPEKEDTAEPLARNSLGSSGAMQWGAAMLQKAWQRKTPMRSSTWNRYMSGTRMSFSSPTSPRPSPRICMKMQLARMTGAR